jgi:hypothetical protein
VLLLQNFEKVVQMIELKRFGGAPNGYPFAPLRQPPATSPCGLALAPARGFRTSDARGGAQCRGPRTGARHWSPGPSRSVRMQWSRAGCEATSRTRAQCDNPSRKIPYYRLNQSTLVIK